MDHFSVIQKLKQAITDLERKRNDVEKQVEQAGRRLEKPTEEAQGWLAKADEIIHNGKNIQAEARKSRTLHPKLDKVAAEKADEAMNHRKIDLGLVSSYAPSSPNVQPMPATGCWENCVCKLI